MLSLFFTSYWFFIEPNMRVYGDETLIGNSATHYDGKHQSVYSTTIALIRFPYFLVNQDVVTGIRFNTLIAIFALFLLFCFIYLLFKDVYIAIISMIILGTFSSFAAMATCMFAPISAIFYFLLASVFFLLFLKYDCISLNIGFLLSLSLAILPRLEYMVVTPCFFFWWIIKKREYLNFKKYSIWYFAKNLGAWLVFFIPLFIYNYFPIYIDMLAIRVRDKYFLSIGHLIINTSSFFDHLTKPSIWPILIYMCVALISIYWIFHKRKIIEGIFPIIIGTALFFTIFSNSHISGYYLIPLYACFGFIYAIPIGLLFRVKHLPIRYVLVFALFAVTIIVLNKTVMQIGTTSEFNPPYTHLTTRAPEIVESNIPHECTIFVSYEHNLLMGTNIMTKQLSDLTNNKFLIRSYDCAYFYEDAMCQKRSINYGTQWWKDCDYMKENFFLIPEMKITSIKDNVSYFVYRIFENESVYYNSINNSNNKGNTSAVKLKEFFV